MSTERFLVTGAFGCLGTWTVKLLIAAGAEVTAFDLASDDHRWTHVMSSSESGAAEVVLGDVTDQQLLRTVMDDRKITNVVHLAGLQFPACQADPVRGAQVNVLGTLSVFGAAAASGSVRGMSYASSASVYGPPEEYSNRMVDDDSAAAPRSFYGAYKVANELTAKAFQYDHRFGSVGLRPTIVFGPGRDTGASSGISIAMVEAAMGRPYEIPFSGSLALSFAPDAAHDFIAAARREGREASVHNISARTYSMDDIVSTIDSYAMTPGLVTCRAVQIPGAVEAVADTPTDFLLHQDELTALADAVRTTMTGSPTARTSH